MILLAADGLENKKIALRLGQDPGKVGRWRRRYVQMGLAGILKDMTRSENPDYPDINRRRHGVTTQNAPQTALESGHGQAVSFKQYRELVRPKDAERFFSIRPAAREMAEKIVSISAA